ncbi:Calcium/calmodulin-dependent 3',5'-cyclic nucleotide phosphodiesterase 1C [Pteropus alecto]|uniref:Calcium/calmodulin-dependent 3',5'-cyclic nucleotide phosphodiesterase 1C n=1 Tax=Pteropus alecto TaxID=9402 RepID=L5KMU9_PTEAL|nr:Calcium/calmodulin-dependent 3',5'-cyclic nucleotide phosphodiesterase 1C [Pteropus alecto]
MLGQWDPRDVPGDGPSKAANKDQSRCLSPTAHGSANAGLKRTLLIRQPLNSISSTEAKRSGVKSAGSEGNAPINNSVIPVDYKSFKATWTEVVHVNRERWRAKVPKEEKAKKEAEEKARLAAEEKQKEMEAKKQAEEDASGKAPSQVGGTRPNKSDNPRGKNSKAGKSSGEKQQNGDLKDGKNKADKKDQSNVGNDSKKTDGTKKRSHGSPAPSTGSTSRLTLPVIKPPLRHFKRPAYASSSYAPSVPKKTEEHPASCEKDRKTEEITKLLETGFMRNFQVITFSQDLFKYPAFYR